MLHEKSYHFLLVIILMDELYTALAEKPFPLVTKNALDTVVGAIICIC